MRKTVSLLIILSMLICLPACGKNKLKDPGNFYYRRTDTVYVDDNSVIAPEQRELAGMREDIGSVLESYLRGPVSSELESPFPRDVAVVQWSMIGTCLHIEMNESFSQLTGIDLTIACACITRTILELTGAESVQIRAKGAMLDGAKYIRMTNNSISFADNSMDKLKTDITLYYTDENNRYLIGHNISVNLASHDDTIAYLIDQLMHAPDENGLVSPIPDGTILLGSRVENGTCALDLSADFEKNAFAQSYAQRITLLSLVNTLTQLDGIESVEFFIEGQPMVRYRQLNVAPTMVYDENAIGPVRTGINEFDATLYLSNSSDLLTAVPIRIRQSSGITQAEMVVKRLIAYQSKNGFSTTIPADTLVNHVYVEDGHCIIDLSSEFLEDHDQIELSVRSIVTSVCALDGISSAQIIINGQCPDGDHADLFLPMTPNTDWYL